MQYHVNSLIFLFGKGIDVCMGKPLGIACNVKDIIVLFKNELIGALAWDACQLLVCLRYTSLAVHGNIILELQNIS